MTQNILIIGAGIIGASAAYHLQKAGASVTVIDAGGPSATQASFGWINASFHKDAHHFRLRVASIAGYRRLCTELSLPINWCSALCWEQAGDALTAQHAALTELGYDVREIDVATFQMLEPHVANPPERCLQFESEGAAESGALASALLEASVELGARAVRGVSVQQFLTKGGRVTVAKTTAGTFSADHILLATGTATQALLDKIEITLPMVPRPALMVHTRPVAQILNHILVTELGELRQLPSGALMIPAAVSHQSDAAEHLPADIEAEAEATVQRLQAMIPETPLSLGQAVIGHRPMPADGLPVIGPVASGIYVATMHSGITLGAIVGDLIAKDMLGQVSAEDHDMLAPYRPDRLTYGIEKGPRVARPLLHTKPCVLERCADFPFCNQLIQ